MRNGERADPPGRMGRRRLRTRAALVTAARRVFAERGVAATTIQHLTDAADVGKGSFYNHFSSKDDVLAAVAEATLGDLALALDRLTEPLLDDPARVLAVSLRHTLRVGVDDPTLGWFLLRAGDVVPVGEAALGAAARRDLQRGIDSGRFAEGDVELLVTAIAGAMAATLRARLRGALPPEADAALARHVLRLLAVPEDEARAIASEPLPSLRDVRTSPNPCQEEKHP